MNMAAPTRTSTVYYRRSDRAPTSRTFDKLSVIRRTSELQRRRPPLASQAAAVHRRAGGSDGVDDDLRVGHRAVASSPSPTSHQRPQTRPGGMVAPPPTPLRWRPPRGADDSPHRPYTLFKDYFSVGRPRLSSPCTDQRGRLNSTTVDRPTSSTPNSVHRHRYAVHSAERSSVPSCSNSVLSALTTRCTHDPRRLGRGRWWL